MHDPFARVRTGTLLLGLLLLEAVNCISYYNITTLNIENYFRNGAQGDFIQSMSSFDDVHILIVLTGVILFEMFKRFRVPSRKIINSIGGATFMVYLIHDNGFFYNIWDKQDWISLLNKSVTEFTIKLFYYTLATFFVGCMAYIVYLILQKLGKSCQNIFIRPESS